jgi:preprotein translocase subunit Sec63
MTIAEAREILGLGLKATRREIRTAYRQAARRWHPDRAPAGAEAEHRARMQQINAAYQRLVKLIEDYVYELADPETPETPEDLQKWWADRFYTGVWSPPKEKDQD